MLTHMPTISMLFQSTNGEYAYLIICGSGVRVGTERSGSLFYIQGASISSAILSFLKQWQVKSCQPELLRILSPWASVLSPTSHLKLGSAHPCPYRRDRKVRQNLYKMGQLTEEKGFPARRHIPSALIHTQCLDWPERIFLIPYEKRWERGHLICNQCLSFFL